MVEGSRSVAETQPPLTSRPLIEKIHSWNVNDERLIDPMAIGFLTRASFPDPDASHHSWNVNDDKLIEPMAIGFLARASFPVPDASHVNDTPHMTPTTLWSRLSFASAVCVLRMSYVPILFHVGFFLSWVSSCLGVCPVALCSEGSGWVQGFGLLCTLAWHQLCSAESSSAADLVAPDSVN